MKNILTTLILILLSINLMAQSPNKLSYQAVVRNSSNALIVNQQVGVKVSILQGNANGTAVYTETHTPTTNANGLISIEIGGGVIIADSFNKVNWANGPYFIKTEIDPNGGVDYTISGTTQLLSVPYALHARTADSIVGGTNFSGNYNDLTNKPITISNIVGDTFKLSNGGYILSAKSVNTTPQPTIITNSVTNITSNGARFMGSITNIGALNIVLTGLIISLNPNPNLSVGGDNIIFNNLDTLFEFGLQSNSIYYVRTYAITENNNYLYGNQVSFTTLSVGQQGPAGGTVFYDKGNTIGGWRYLEAAPTDQSSGIHWGCADSINFIGTNTKFGFGESNTNMIVASCNDSNFAAKLCSNLVLGGKSDWFLPSSDELKLLLNNMRNSFQLYNSYWSSSEDINAATRVFICFLAESRIAVTNQNKNSNSGVRAIRKF